MDKEAIECKRNYVKQKETQSLQTPAKQKRPE
jgi:hypothetical protein